MKAIQVKWLGATNTLPSRVKAWTSGGHETIESTSEFHDLSEEEIVRAIAQKHIEKMQRDCVITGVGCLPDNTWAVTIGNPKKDFKTMLNKLVQEWQVTGGNVMHTTMREAEVLLKDSQ